MVSDSKPTNGNGNGNAWWRAWLSPSVLLTVTGLLLAGAIAWSQVQSHCQDTAVHHTATQLDQSYVRNDINEEQTAGIERRLERIEGKLDKLSDDVAALK